MADLFGNKVLFVAYEVKFCSVARLRMDILFEFGCINLIYKLAGRLTTILSALPQHERLFSLAGGCRAIKIAYAIRERAILHPSLLATF